MAVDHPQECARGRSAVPRGRLLAVVAGMHIAMGCVGIGVPLFAIALGADSFDLGVIGAVGTAVYTALAILFGRLSDRVGRRLLILTAPFLYSAAVLIAAFSHSWQSLVPVTVVTAAAMAMLWPAYMALVAETAPVGGLVRQIAAYNLAWCGGIVLGNSAGGALAGRLVVLPLFVGAAAAASVGLALAVFARRLPPAHGTGSDAPPDGEMPLSATRARALLGACWCAMFASVFGIAAIRMLFPELALNLRLTPAAIGLLIAVVTVGQAVMFIVLGWGGWWRYRLAPLWAAQISSVAAYVAVAVGRSWLVFVVAFAVIGAANALAYTSGYYYGVNRALRRGAFAGMHEAILGAGSALGPLAGGFLGRTMGLRAPYYLAATVVATAVLLELCVHFCVRKGAPLVSANGQPKPGNREGGHDVARS
jgi:MFS family permease